MSSISESSTSGSSLAAAVSQAARAAGMVILSSRQGAGFDGQPTEVCLLGLSADRAATFELELSSAFDATGAELLPAMTSFLGEQVKRLRNPLPGACVTVAGLPVAMSEFHWPFHRSVSGADTYIVHGVVSLADGSGLTLHAKVAASMTVTFAEILLAPEQPYAETFIYNAIRKTLDQGQLEMLKSGNRQPVPVTTRYYSRWQKKFLFSDSDSQTREQFLMAKAFWLSGILGNSQPVWIADPRDAQYLNTTEEEFAKVARELGQAGLLALSADGEFASATPALMEREEFFRHRLEQALEFTKPTFNEEMRAGHTNM
jgi:hypothetical protein